MDLRRSLAAGVMVACLVACAPMSSASAPMASPAQPSSVAVASLEPSPVPSLRPDPSLTPSPTDESAPIDTPPPPECPSHLPAQPMHLHDLGTIDPLCLGTTSIVIVGWEAPSGEVGFEGPGVEPAWLIYPTAATSSALWDWKPDAAGRCFGGDGCDWDFVHVAPGSPITFNGRGHWVRVTAHLNDPAATTCHYVYPSGSTQTEHLPDSDAQHWCAGSIVLEKVEVIAAP